MKGVNFLTKYISGLILNFKLKINLNLFTIRIVKQIALNSET